MDISEVDSDLAALDNLAKGLDSHPDQKTLEKQVAKVEKKLNDLREHTREGFPEIRPDLKERTLQVLSHVSASLKENKIDQLSKAALVLSQTIASSPDKIQRPIEVGLKIAVFSTIDAPDHNFAITSNLEIAIKTGVPFIATRSLLKGKEVESGDYEYPVSGMRLETALLQTEDKWEIFQQGEMVVFLPKSLAPHLSGLDKLKALDFVSDGTLKPVSLKKAFQGPSQEAHFDDFFKLFSADPNVNKVFFLNGHGDSKTVGGLDQVQYEKFLNFLDRQRCQGLLISSCYSGGQSSLLLTSPQDKNQVAGFESSAARHKFPTVARSIGDFPTHALQAAEDSLHFFLNEMADFATNDQSKTVGHLRRKVENAEQGHEMKSSVNLMKVYLPQSGDAVGGLVAVNEGGRGLSYTLAEQAARAKEKKPIVVQKKEFLEVHPVITEARLEISGTMPALISMIPGQGHHYFSDVKIVDNTVEEFFNRNISFYKEADTGNNKAYFFEKIEAKDKTVEKAVLVITQNGARYLYQEKGKCYFYDGTLTKEISSREYAILCLQIENESKASLDAVRATSRGHETEAMFHEKFIEGFSIDPRLLSTDINQLLAVLSPEEAPAMIFYLMEQNRPDLAQEILTKKGVSPDIKDRWGTPLICLAVEQKYSSFVKYLIHRCDVNVLRKGPSGRTPLYLALQGKDPTLIQLLLNAPKVDVNLENGHGLTVYSIAFLNEGSDSKIVKEMQQKGAKNDSKQGQLIFTDAVRRKKTEVVNALLDWGCDPNEGSPSPLQIAIEQNDMDLVKKLMEKGGNPFVKNQDGKVLLIEAILKSSPEMVAFLVKHPDCAINVTDMRGFTPYLAALFIEDEQKIEGVKSMGGAIPSTIYELAGNVLGEVALRYASRGDTARFHDLIQTNLASKGELYQIFITKLSSKSLAELIQNKEIDPTFILPSGKTVFQAICDRISKEKIDLSLPLRACLERGVEFTALSDRDTYFNILVSTGDIDLLKLAKPSKPMINGQEGQRIPLQQALLIEQPELREKVFFWLLDQGANVDQIGERGLTAVGSIIEKGDKKLLEHLMSRGYQISTSEQKSNALFAVICSGDVSQVEQFVSQGYQLQLDKVAKGNLLLRAYQGGGSRMLEKVLDMIGDAAQMTDKEREELSSLLVQRGDLRSVDILLSAKFSPVMENGTNILLSLAVGDGMLEFLKLLRERGFKVTPNELDYDTLYQLLRNDDVDIAKFLSHDPKDFKNKKWMQTIFENFDFFRPKKPLSILLYLIEIGVNLEGVDEPLHTAIKADDLTLIQIVLDGGGIKDLNALGGYPRKTAKELAEESSNPEIISLIKKYENQ